MKIKEVLKPENMNLIMVGIACTAISLVVIRSFYVAPTALGGEVVEQKTVEPTQAVAPNQATEPVHTDLPGHDVEHISPYHLETWQTIGVIIGGTGMLLTGLYGLIKLFKPKKSS